MIAIEPRLKAAPLATRPQSIVPEYEAEWFAGHDRIVAPIRRHLTVFPEQCQCLIDIGTGDGAVLDDIASRLPQFKSFIGITADWRALNKARVRVHYDSRLAFHYANPWAWLRNERQSRAIAFSYDNLSILPESPLEDWFAELRRSGIAGIALIEPQDGGCAQLPAMLRLCGWTIRHAENRYQAGRAWWHVFATVETHADSLEAAQ